MGHVYCALAPKRKIIQPWNNIEIIAEVSTVGVWFKENQRSTTNKRDVFFEEQSLGKSGTSDERKEYFSGRELTVEDEEEEGADRAPLLVGDRGKRPSRNEQTRNSILHNFKCKNLTHFVISP